MQQFAVQVAESMTYWVWHVDISTPGFKYASPFAFTRKLLCIFLSELTFVSSSDPLYELRQRFRFQCQEVRTSTDGKYLGRRCFIIAEALDPNSTDAAKKVEQCLGARLSDDTSTLNGGLVTASCQVAADNPSGFLWNIRESHRLAKTSHTEPLSIGSSLAHPRLFALGRGCLERIPRSREPRLQVPNGLAPLAAMDWWPTSIQHRYPVLPMHNAL